MFAAPICDYPLDHYEMSVCLRDLVKGHRPPIVSTFRPMSKRAELHAEFSEVVTECSLADWNGERADPISREIITAGQKLISQLPEGVKSPSVGAIPEGLLTFEWYKNPRCMVLVVPNRSNGIDYVIRKGEEILHGSAPFYGKLPDTILSQLHAFG